MALARLDPYCRVVQTLDSLPEQIAQTAALFIRGPSGAAIGDVAVGVGGREVSARRDLVRSEVEVEPQGLQNATADVVLRVGRVVAEERQVRRAAAGRDPLCHRDDSAQRRARRHGVEVGDPRRLQGGCRLRGGLDVADAVEHQQDDLGIGRPGQPGEELRVAHQTTR